MDAYAAYFARKLDRWFLDESLSPLARLRAFIEDARTGMARFDYRRGCLVGNLGQQIATLPDMFRDRLAAVFLIGRREPPAVWKMQGMQGRLTHMPIARVSPLFSGLVGRGQCSAQIWSAIQPR